MPIEDLPDTVLYTKRRIPLSEFVAIPASNILKPGEKGTATPVPEHPRRYFRSCPGFYLCNDFFTRFHRHLTPRPLWPGESHLFIWTLKKDCSFSAAMHSFEGKNHPVPWWVIRPLIAYEASQDHQPLLSSICESVFFMSATGDDEKTFREPVSLSFSYGTLHTEWRLKLFVPEQGHKCREGQFFFSVL